jgi:tRNA(Ile)-lysidine synthase
MASTRRSAPADGARDAVEAAVDRALAGLAGRRLAVALSGGRDSTALLHACAVIAPRHGIALSAIHVHHGLSAHADAWAAACERSAASLTVPLVGRRVAVANAGDGIEAAARRARYAALRSTARERAIDAIALAHHEDDQAETLLLQALRGAGPHGLAAMAPVRRDADGLVWVRPLLGVARSAIEAHVARYALAYVDDDSNDAPRHRRNALRREVMPVLARTFPVASRTLARAASHQAEAVQLMDDLAAQDAAPLVSSEGLDVVGLALLPPHRARNVLRHFLHRQGLRLPSTARLAAMLQQLAPMRADAHTELVHERVRFGVFRGRLLAHPAPPSAFEHAWCGEPCLALAHGQLAFVPALGEGIAAEVLTRHRVVVRSRVGGERLTLDPARPRRALKSWLHEAGLPPWERAALPLVFCDETLAAVPGVGIDIDFQAPPGKPGYRIDWQPSR